MHDIVLAVSLSPTGDWTQAAAIMTFAIPVGIFVVVATWLFPTVAAVGRFRRHGRHTAGLDRQHPLGPDRLRKLRPQANRSAPVGI